MPRGKTSGGKPPKRRIERYEHADKKRINNPPVGLVTPETDPLLPTHKTYGYVERVPSVRRGKELDYDPHLDPIPSSCGRARRSTHRSKSRPSRSTFTSGLTRAPSWKRYASATVMACRRSRRCSSAGTKIRRCARPLTSTATRTAGRIA